MKRVDDLLERRRGAALLSEPHEAEIRLLAVLEDGVELGGELDGAETED